MEQITSNIKFGEGFVLHERSQKKRLSFKYPIFHLLIPLSEFNKSVLNFKNFRFLRLLSSDYLDNQTGSLLDKINLFLETKLSYKPETIFLQTTPRIFGYVFNPVNFWYCYVNKKLDAVLCEVNNTFGDRHFYFVQISTNKKKLVKSFHVSPFFKIEGFYNFNFALTDQTSRISIDYFKDEKNLLLHTKLELRWFSFSEITFFKIIKKYGWMTLMVSIRIHLQALKLWIKKTPFYRRPQPPLNEVTK